MASLMYSSLGITMSPIHAGSDVSSALDRAHPLAYIPGCYEIHRLGVQGKSTVNKEIATELLIGESTVKTHIVHIFNKLGVKVRADAVAEAARRRILRL